MTWGDLLTVGTIVVLFWLAANLALLLVLWVVDTQRSARTDLCRCQHLRVEHVGGRDCTRCECAGFASDERFASHT